MSSGDKSPQYDLGTCEEHQRPLEAYCTKCHVLVCPTCVMFEAHRLHEVIQPDEAVRQMRDAFDKNIRSGKLKVESTESILVDIRQALVQCDQTKNRLLKEVDRTMTDLIDTLKNRKNELLAMIDDYFKKEKDTILSEEAKWRERQKICEDLLKMSSRKDSDQEILIKSKYVADGLAALNEKQKFNEMKLINSLDTVLKTKMGESDVEVTAVTLRESLKNFIQICEYKRLQYKC